MPQGQPRKDTVAIKARIPRELITRLFFEYPNLFKPNDPTTVTHGGWGRYITTLIKRDLDNKEEKEDG